MSGGLSPSLPPAAIAAAAACAVVTAAGTALVLCLARRFQLLDEPNERSAHREPTPTLGGVAIVAGVAAGLGLAAGLPPAVRLGAWAGLAALLPVVVDDLRRPLTVWQKLAVQLLAVAAWLAVGPALAVVHLPGIGAVDPGPWAGPLAAGWLLWMMNVHNFMDGIDGITATHTLVVGLAAAACLATQASALAALPLLTAAAAAGFLPFNRPRARIFMGDVGSQALGFLVGITALAGAGEGLPLWASLLIVAVYAVDTGHTLVRRWLRRANVLRAHQEHLYQRLVQSGWSAGRVDSAVALLAAAFGASAWCLVQGHRAAGLFAAGVAALPLLWAVLWKEGRFRG